MKRALMVVVVCFALGGLVVASQATAANNVPKLAKKLSVEFVTAYNPCTAPTLTHRPSLAFPACPPGQSSANNPANIYSFGQKNGKPDGSASVKLQAGNGDTKLLGKSKAVWLNGAPYTGTDLTGTAIMRKTDNGCGGAFDVDCTVVDFPGPVGLTCTNGSCKTSAATTNAILPGATHEGDATNTDIGQIEVIDQDGDDVFRAGLFVGPSDPSSAYNTPKQARKMAIAMVTAYNQCTAPTLTHRPSLAYPACVPVQSSANNPANSYEFGLKNGAPDGSASVTLLATNGNVKFAVKSKALWKNGAPYSGTDLHATAVLRATDNGCGAGFDVDCTMVDFPFPVDLTCTAGSCASTAPDANGVLPGAVYKDDGSNIEIGQISIVDEDGDAVARGGLFNP